MLHQWTNCFPQTLINWPNRGDIAIAPGFLVLFKCESSIEISLPASLPPSLPPSCNFGFAILQREASLLGSFGHFSLLICCSKAEGRACSISNHIMSNKQAIICLFWLICAIVFASGSFENPCVSVDSLEFFLGHLLSRFHAESKAEHWAILWELLGTFGRTCLVSGTCLSGMQCCTGGRGGGKGEPPPPLSQGQTAWGACAYYSPGNLNTEKITGREKKSHMTNQGAESNMLPPVSRLGCLGRICLGPLSLTIWWDPLLRCILCVFQVYQSWTFGPNWCIVRNLIWWLLKETDRTH